MLIVRKLFDGVKHSDVPALEAILKGKADMNDMVFQGVEVAGKGEESVGVKAVTKD
jgi:hypothetical protein